jgi:hypothetical protein
MNPCNKFFLVTALLLLEVRKSESFSCLKEAFGGGGSYTRKFPRGSFLAMNPSTEPEREGSIDRGDPVREATGIRASLHPTTINAIADALRFRASKKKDNDGKDLFFRVSEMVKPLDVALTAGQIASTAISRRQLSSCTDGMKLTPEEQQTIAGRILGVIMRLDDLEEALFRRVSEIDWIAQYDEWSTFGVVKNESESRGAVDERVVTDPLFCLSRAECLLAIFLHEVEIPQLERVKEAVPDDSKIDFLDADRLEALLPSQISSSHGT